MLFLLISEEKKQSSPKSRLINHRARAPLPPLSSNSAHSFPGPRLEELVCPAPHTVLMSSALTPTNQNRRQLPTVLLLRDTFCAQPLAIFCLFAARVYPSLNCLFVMSSSSTIVAKLFFSARSANKRALRLSHSLIIFLNVNIAIRFWCSAAIPAAARDHIYKLFHS